jgi:hypothetical protein
VTLERFGSEELPEPHARGFAPSEAIRPDPPALGRSAFLLDPGGEDYVGKNSYDNASRMDE